MNATTYNGWTNYETWNVALWLDNDASSYRYSREQAQEAYNDASADRSFTRKENAAFALADTLKEQHESAMADMLESAGQTSSVWADLLGAALSEVNWREIAEHYLDDVDEESDDDDDNSEPSDD